jgi:hypothetical protein
MESVLIAQKKEIGIFHVAEMKRINDNQGTDLEKMKVKSEVGGGITSYEWPDAKITDLLEFIHACQDTGKEGDILDVLEVKKGEQLNKFVAKWKLKEFPGLSIKTQIKTVNK